MIIPAALAGFLCLHGLADKPLWLDEVTTFSRANLGFSALIENSLHNKHLPTYFLLERYFDGPIVDEMLLRIPSVLFVGLTVLFLALIATEVFTPAAGLLAGLLAAVAPIEIQFGQEARPYALATCLATIALWGFLRLVRTELDPARPRSAWAGWAAYLIGTAAAVNVLVASMAWFITANVLVTTGGVLARSARFRRNWLVVQAIIVLTFLPGLFGLFHFSGHDPFEGHKWVPESTISHVYAVLGSTYLFRFSNVSSFAFIDTPFPWLGGLVALFACWGAFRVGNGARERTTLLAAALAMPLCVFVVSLWHPFWVPRYLMWSVGPYFVLAGIGLASLPRLATIAYVLVIGGAAAANVNAYYGSETKPRWDLAAKYLANSVGPDDLLVVNDSAARYVLSAYAPRYGLDPARILIDAEFRDRFRVSPPVDRLWAIYGRTGQGEIPSETAYLGTLSLVDTPRARLNFGPDIVGLRFDHPAVQSANVGAALR